MKNKDTRPVATIVRRIPIINLGSAEIGLDIRHAVASELIWAAPITLLPHIAGTQVNAVMRTAPYQPEDPDAPPPNPSRH